jgi:uncharacterized RDD family membrane protein YckC
LNGSEEIVAPPLGRRMACWLYEGVLLFGVVFVAGFVFSVAAQMRSGIDDRRWLLDAFMFVVFGIYFTWFWSKGQTLAMRTWNIRVVDRYGRRLTQGRALIRYVYGWLWVLPPLAAFQSKHFGLAEISVVFVGWVAFWALLSRFHPGRQFMHDLMAGTRLVSATR